MESASIETAFAQWAAAVLHTGSGAFFVDSVAEKSFWQAGWGSFSVCDFAMAGSFMWSDFTGENLTQGQFAHVAQSIEALPQAVCDFSALPLFDAQSSQLHETPKSWTNKGKRMQQAALDGELWVANLTHGLTGDLPDARALLRAYAQFLALEQPHIGGVIWMPDCKLICLGPEVFIRIMGQTITAQPMKGTGTREYLTTSQKEASELMMVTDLLRNDLSQISTQVQVPQRQKLLQWGDLWQAQAVINGQLAGRITRGQYQQLLPAGSVSGAPKHRVLQYIDQLESRPRGMYCGTFGAFDGAGDFRSCVLIRTVVAEGNRWYYGTGAGITHRSDLAAEWHETLDKTQFLQRIAG